MVPQLTHADGSPHRPTFLANTPKGPAPSSKNHEFHLPPNPYPPTTYKFPSIISAPKSTSIHKSQLTTHQHLTNFWTNRPPQNRPKRAFSCPYIGNTTPQPHTPNTPSPIHHKPQPITPPTHPYASQTPNQPPPMTISNNRHQTKNTLRILSVTPYPPVTYKHPQNLTHHPHPRLPQDPPTTRRRNSLTENNLQHPPPSPIQTHSPGRPTIPRKPTNSNHPTHRPA